MTDTTPQPIIMTESPVAGESIKEDRSLSDEWGG